MYLLQHHKTLNKPQMPDGDSKTYKKLKKTRTSDSVSKRHVLDVGSVLQSFWIRCRTIFPNSTDRKFMESELCFVLYCGTIFWFIYLLHQIIT
jgi:hypothetical protein